MNRELIEELRNKARIIGHRLCRNRLGGAWAEFDLDRPSEDPIDFRITGEGSIEFYRPSDRARIGFFDIKPKKVNKSRYFKPVLSNTILEDVNATVIVNDSENSSIKRTYTYTEDESNFTEQEAGVDVAIGLRQQIGYGGAVSPVTGETEISISISAHYNKTWGSENSKGKEVSNTVDVPPKTEISISTQKSTSDFSQKAEHDIELDFKVGLFSAGDYDVTINNIAELEDVINGVGKESHQLTKFFKNSPSEQWEQDQILKPSLVTIKQEINFSNASTGAITVTERKL